MSARDVLTQATERIRADRTHGASFLAREAAQALADATGATGATETERGDTREQWSVLAASIRPLAEARPSMAALATTVASIWSAGQSDAATSGLAPTDDEARSCLARMHAAARAMVERWAATDARILEYARPLLGSDLFTTSRSGTVEAVLRALAQEGRLHHLWVARSFPGNEGLALAKALIEDAPDLRVTVVADAACGSFISQSRGVVIGADSVWDGGAVNKVGSYLLALAARAAGIPCFVLCATLKIGGTRAPDIEEMDPREIVPDTPPGVDARNPYFESVPRDLITAVITEDGVLDASALAARARLAEETLRSLPPPEEEG